MVRILVSKTRDTGSSPVRPTKMKKDKNLSLEELLSNKYLISRETSSIKVNIDKIRHGKSLRLVYGETYDRYGMTLDSLKYYFFISLLAKVLNQEGIHTTATVIIGDLHSVKNEIVENKDDLLLNASNRIELINKINSIYNLQIEPILMSKMFKENKFEERLKKIIPIFNNSEKLKSLAQQTVLKNRLTQEKKIGFQYTLEEVALIVDFDIKIGPPRETYYDQIASIICGKIYQKDFYGVYLKPTYPLGFQFDYFINHPEIEKFGLTPYKAGSNKLQENRIIVESTTLSDCQKLINSSFVAKNPILPNPVLEVYIISQMAESFLSNNQFTLDDQVIGDPELLKKIAYKKLFQNIYKPLNLKI